MPVLGDFTYVDDISGPTSAKQSWDRILGMQTLPVQGRLTVSTGVPIPVTDQTAQGTLYYTPYLGQIVTLYDGTRWRMYSTAEISIALTVTSGKNYDVFLYDNAGTITIELSAAWTNDTTRADALAAQDGVQVKSAAHTRRWVGTIRASGANVTEDSAANRFVWNHYNRTLRQLRAADASAFTRNGAGPTEQSTSLRMAFVLGEAGQTLAQIGSARISVGAGTFDARMFASLDTSNDSELTQWTMVSGGNDTLSFKVPGSFIPSIGYHYLTIYIQEASGLSTVTFDQASNKSWIWGYRMANDYLLQEDGASKIILEDGTGDLILESSSAVGFQAAWALQCNIGDGVDAPAGFP